MQTPLTPRGRETDRLMRLWRDQNPDADASAYNREWDKVYVKLEGTFSDAEDRGSSPIAILFEEEVERLSSEAPRDPYPVCMAISSDDPPAKVQPRNPRHKHPVQTKGAFGKPKLLKKR